MARWKRAPLHGTLETCPTSWHVGNVPHFMARWKRAPLHGTLETCPTSWHVGNVPHKKGWGPCPTSRRNKGPAPAVLLSLKRKDLPTGLAFPCLLLLLD